jgi:hypothetical protein
LERKTSNGSFKGANTWHSALSTSASSSRTTCRHKLFQRPVTTTHLSHESSKAFNLGVPGDPMTFQTDFIATLDHVGTLDAFRHVNPNGKPVDEMPLDLFMGKAVYFEPTSRPRSRRITVPHMEEGEKKAGVNVNGHIVPLCTGFHKRTYPRLDSVWKDKKLPAGRP